MTTGFPFAFTAAPLIAEGRVTSFWYPTALNADAGRDMTDRAAALVVVVRVAVFESEPWLNFTSTRVAITSTSSAEIDAATSTRVLEPCCGSPRRRLALARSAARRCCRLDPTHGRFFGTVHPKV